MRVKAGSVRVQPHAKQIVVRGDKERGAVLAAGAIASRGAEVEASEQRAVGSDDE
jgi:hypothetical protein